MSFPIHRSKVPGPSDHAGKRVTRAGRRGSVLIVALLIAALIAVALASYLNLNLTSSRLARRTFNGYGALNLAEAGTEEGVWSFNRATAGESSAWDGWTKDGSAAWQKFTNFNFGPNLSGSVKVYVNNTAPAPGVQPRIAAQASLGAAGESPALRLIEVTLRRRAYFASGLVAKDGITFSGANASVDSWNSDPDADAATAPIPYSTEVRQDNGSVASVAVANTAVILNQAHIWGYVATGGSQPQVGTNGTIRGASTPANVLVDSSRIATDFNADFDLVSAPVDGTQIITLGATLGTAGEETKWRTTGITLSGNETLTILGDVILVLTAGSGSPALSVTGNATILVPEDSSLTVYTEGSIKIAGKGLGNSNVQPISCQIWGTNATAAGQQIDVAGNGDLKTVIYAPFGDVTVNGNGAVMGSIVGRSIRLVGNAAFHYDEALAAREGDEPYTISKWRELTSEADRARYQQVFEKF